MSTASDQVPEYGRTGKTKGTNVSVFSRCLQYLDVFRAILNTCPVTQKDGHSAGQDHGYLLIIVGPVLWATCVIDHVCPRSVGAPCCTVLRRIRHDRHLKYCFRHFLFPVSVVRRSLGVWADCEDECRARRFMSPCQSNGATCTCIAPNLRTSESSGISRFVCWGMRHRNERFTLYKSEPGGMSIQRAIMEIHAGSRFNWHHARTTIWLFKFVPSGLVRPTKRDSALAGGYHIRLFHPVYRKGRRIRCKHGQACVVCAWRHADWVRIRNIACFLVIGWDDAA